MRADPVRKQRRCRGRTGQAVADDAQILGSDLLFYRAGHPERWWRGSNTRNPLVVLGGDTLGAHVILPKDRAMSGQPDSPSPNAQDISGRPWSIAALHVSTMTGSALLALALMHGVLDQDQVWAAAMSTRTGTSIMGVDQESPHGARRGWSISEAAAAF